MYESEKNLRKLLSDIELGDRKPSHMLNEMVRLGGSSVTDEFLKTAWMARLPPQIQSIITTSADTLSSLAKMWDKVMKNDHPRTSSGLPNTVKELAKEVAELRTALRDSSTKHSPHLKNLK